MSRAVVLHPALRLSAFYAATFLVTGIQLPFWPIWLASRGLTAREIGVLLAAAIWVKVLATPAIGALADKTGGRRVLMGALAAAALAAYAGLLSAGSFWLLISLNLVALTAQSALMPLGDTITLAAVRSEGLDYGRIRLWGSVSFIFASIASGAALASSSGERVLPLVLGASALVLLACLRSPVDPPSRGCGSDRWNWRCRRRPQVLDLYPCRIRSAGEPSSLLRLRNALLALAGFLGHDDRLALGGRGPRRNLALLAGPAAARPARADRIDGARGRRRHSALEPRRRADLAPVHCGPAASARLHIRSEPPRSHALPLSCGAALGSGKRAKPLCRTVVGSRQRPRNGDRGSALLSLWGRRLLFYGRALRSWVGGSSGIRPDNRSTEPLALLTRSVGKEGRRHDPLAAWSPSTSHAARLSDHAGAPCRFSPQPAWRCLCG